MNSLKRAFIAGLIFIVPISLSVWILFKTMVFFENILGGFFKRYLPGFYTPGAGVLILILIILLIGFLADNFLGKKMLSIFERLFEKTPLLNKIYIFIKGVSRSLLHGQSSAFRAAVKIEFPNGMYAIGFITGQSDKKGFVSIFVPTVPNISTGFYLMVPEKKVERLNLTVEETLKMVISLGMFEPENGADKNRSDSLEKD